MKPLTPSSRRPSFRELAVRYWSPFFLLVVVARFLDHPYVWDPLRRTPGYWLSGPIYQAFFLLSLVILLDPRGRNRWGEWTGWWGLDGSLWCLILSQGMKLLFHLPRPAPSHSLAGFPSGHTMWSFTLATLVTQRYPALAPVWFGIGMAVGWSRINTHAHYLYQVIFGGIFGMLLGLSVSADARGLLFPRVLLSRRRRRLASRERTIAGSD